MPLVLVLGSAVRSLAMVGPVAWGLAVHIAMVLVMAAVVVSAVLVVAVAVVVVPAVMMALVMMAVVMMVHDRWERRREPELDADVPLRAGGDARQAEGEEDRSGAEEEGGAHGGVLHPAR